jgi:hypothetical protein
MISLKSATIRMVFYLAAGLFLTSPAARSIEVIRENIPFNNYFGAGARAMGMGGAYMAVGDDLSSLHWNPAGLGLVRRVEAAASLSHESLRSRTSFFDESRSTPDNRTRFNSGGIVLPVPVYQGSLVFAFGVNRVHSFDGKYLHSGLDTAPDPDETIRFKEEREVRRGGLHQWSAGMSLEVDKGLFLGGAFNAWTGSYDYKWSLRIQDTRQISVVDYSLDRWDGEAEFRGYNLTFGTVYRRQYFRLGLTLTTPTTFHLGGDDREASLIVFDDGEEERSAALYDFADEKFPMTAGAGLAMTLPWLIIEADVRHVGWDILDEGEEFLAGDKPRYRSSNEFHLGGELFVPFTPLRLRGGYYVDPIAFRGVDIVSDRSFYTLGLGILLERALAVDIAVVRGNWELSQPYYTANSKTTRMFTSLSYRF